MKSKRKMKSISMLIESLNDCFATLPGLLAILGKCIAITITILAAKVIAIAIPIQNLKSIAIAIPIVFAILALP